MTEIVGFVLVGLAAGVLSGLLGIGGAIVIIPALVYIFGFPQHRAAGTTLALMVAPIGFFAVLPYFRKGLVDVRAAVFICVGFILGGLIGGRLAVAMPEGTVQKLFGILLLGVAAKMLFR